MGRMRQHVSKNGESRLLHGTGKLTNVRAKSGLAGLFGEKGSILLPDFETNERAYAA